MKKTYVLELEGNVDEEKGIELLLNTIPNSVRTAGYKIVGMQLRQNKEQTLKVPGPSFFERR